MPASIAKKVEDLKLAELIQTSADYQSGFGIAIDNSTRTISADKIELKTEFINIVDGGCYAANSSGIAKGIQTSALTPNSIAQGTRSVAGGYALKMISGDLNTNKIMFRSNLSSYKDLLDDYVELSGKVSYKLEGNYTQKMSIVSIDYDANTIEFTQIPMPINPADNYDAESNTFYLASPRYLQYTMWFPQKGPRFATIGDIQLGDGSMALGYECVTFADECHAEGCQTTAQGRYAHAEGYMTNAGYSAHAQGTSTEALGHYSHAEGWNTHALEELTHAAGFLAYAKDRNSFVWNGNTSSDDPLSSAIRGQYLSSHGVGTFNIGPRNGISGVWIGDKSLDKILDEHSGGGSAGDIAYLSGQIDAIRDLIGDIDSIVNDILT